MVLDTANKGRGLRDTCRMKDSISFRIDYLVKFLMKTKIKFIPSCNWKIQGVKWLQATFDLGCKCSYLILASCPSLLGFSLCGLTPLYVLVWWQQDSNRSSGLISTKLFRVNLFPQKSQQESVHLWLWLGYMSIPESVTMTGVWSTWHESHTHARRSGVSVEMLGGFIP